MIIGRYSVIPEYVLGGVSEFDTDAGKQYVTIYYDIGDDVRELVQATAKDNVAKKWLKQIDECVELGSEERTKESDND